MYAAELLSKLRYLTLTVDENKKPEFVGTEKQWQLARWTEASIYEFRKIWK